MPVCTRPSAVNYNVEGRCLSLVRVQDPGLHVTLQRTVVTDYTDPGSYLVQFTGPVVAGQLIHLAVSMQGGYEGAPETINSAEWTTVAGASVEASAAAVANNLLVAYPGFYSFSTTVVDGDSNVVDLLIWSESDGWFASGLTTVTNPHYKCHAFGEVLVADNSLTLSWYPSSGNWMFFHDYSPNVYFRDKIDSFCLDSAIFYRMNKGSRGIYTGPRKPFILDICFRWEGDVIIDHVSWQSAIAATPFSSFTHITVSTREFSTGRVAIAQRRVQGWFSFNRLRDVVINLPFLDTVYNDFNVMSAAIDPTTAWFKQGLLEDNYCIVRLEYDGSNDIVFLGAETTQQPAFR